MVVRCEAVEDRLAGAIAVDAELGEQLAVEVGVAEPDHRPGEAGGVERRGEHLDDLRGALGGLGADQLDPGLA